MSFGNYLAVFLIAIVTTATVNAQSIGVNGTVEGGTNNGTGSALISFEIIGNSTLDPAIRNAIEALRNATVNGTEAVRRAISEAARELVTNGNLTYGAIINFLEAAQRNITATGNANLTEIITRVREYAQTNRQQVQAAIEAFAARFRNDFQDFLAQLNQTAQFFAGLFPPIPPFPSIRPFPFPSIRPFPFPTFRPFPFPTFRPFPFPSLRPFPTIGPIFPIRPPSANASFGFEGFFGRR